MEEALRDRYRTAILAGEVPLKLAYCADDGVGHDFFSRSPSYASNVLSISDELDVIVGAFPPKSRIGLCDIGPGNSLHAIQLAKECALANRNIERYLALDISPGMLVIGASEISAALPNVVRSAAVWDFEVETTDVIFSWYDDCHSAGVQPLLGLMGGTLGNVTDPLASLKNVATSCASGSRMIIGLALTPASVDEALAGYRVKSFTDAALSPFGVLGFDLADLTVLIHWQDGSVVADVVPIRTIHLPGALDTWPRDFPVTIFRSHRFTVDEAITLVNGAGWSVEGFREAGRKLTLMLSRN